MSAFRKDELERIAKGLGCVMRGVHTVESLKQLITDKLAGTEAEKRPESLAVSALPTHFEKQRFTDLEIRVKLRSIAPAIQPGADPPTLSIQLPPTVPRGSSHRAKSIRRRPRSWTMEPMYMMDSDSDDDYFEAEEPAAKRARRASLPPVHNRRATVKAHSLILASRSEFFEEKLADDPAAGPSSGGTARRVVDVTLEDEDEYEVFYLLVKLSYTETYVRDGERELGAEELLQMLGTARAFGFKDASTACASALRQTVGRLAQHLTLKRALQFLKAGDALLKGHSGYARVQERAETLLAQHVGPLCKVLETGVFAGDEWPLSIKDMPLVGMEALLGSKHLQLQSENETFNLMCQWVEEQPPSSRQEAFKRLAKKLRFEAMTPDFILGVVTSTHRIIEAGLQAEVPMAGLRGESLCRLRSADYKALRGSGVTRPVSRVPTGAPRWCKTVKFEALRHPQPRPSLSTDEGIMGAYPWVLQLRDGHNVSSPYNATLTLSTSAFDHINGGNSFCTITQPGFFVAARLTLPTTGDTWTSEPSWVSPKSPAIIWKDAFKGKRASDVLARHSEYMEGDHLAVEVELTWRRPGQAEEPLAAAHEPSDIDAAMLPVLSPPSPRHPKGWLTSWKSATG